MLNPSAGFLESNNCAADSFWVSLPDYGSSYRVLFRVILFVCLVVFMSSPVKANPPIPTGAPSKSIRLILREAPASPLKFALQSGMHGFGSFVKLDAHLEQKAKEKPKEKTNHTNKDIKKPIYHRPIPSLLFVLIVSFIVFHNSREIGLVVIWTATLFAWAVNLIFFA